MVKGTWNNLYGMHPVVYQYHMLSFISVKHNDIPMNSLIQSPQPTNIDLEYTVQNQQATKADATAQASTTRLIHQHSEYELCTT
jgi:hypothetical protein